MDPIWIVRTLFVLTMSLCGYWVGSAQGDRGTEFLIFAFGFSLFFVLLEYATRAVSAKKVFLGMIGAFAGLAFSRLFRDTFPESMVGSVEGLNAVSNLLFMYFGIVLALRNADRISVSRFRFFLTNPREDAVLIDSSVIIDGRVQDLFAMGVLRYDPIVPSFIIDELQTLADSKDAIKRHNGRKGLDHLEELREIVPFQLIEKDFPDAPDVDHKLISLAKEFGATILTNDFNLTKVASLHQVRSININAISAALRPTLNIGDRLMLTVKKAGKDPRQGVGHLEDGTMVVVDEASQHLGETIPIEVTSMMQTNAGRLVFAKLNTHASGETQPKIELVK